MKKKADPPPKLFGLTPKKIRNQTFLWKKGAFEARAWPTTVLIERGNAAYWAWEWTLGGRYNRGTSRGGLDGCIAFLEQTLETERAVLREQSRILTGLLGRTRR